VEVGVPQGSVLGPILFTVMVNDLSCNVTSSKVVLFADDTTLLTISKSIDHLKVVAAEALVQAISWFMSNGLGMNESKTQTVIYSLLNSRGNENDNAGLNYIKLLGIKIDARLTWTHHIEYVCAKLSRVIYLLKSLKCHVPNGYLLNVYYALFHSVICYGLILWGNAAKIQDVLLLQKKST